MKYILFIIFIIGQISCTKSVKSGWEIERHHLKKNIEMGSLIEESECKNQEQFVRFKKFLGLNQNAFDDNKPNDTIITLYHDYSYAGFMGGKYCQIIKSFDNVLFKEVFYSNVKSSDGNNNFFRFFNYRTGMMGDSIYPYFHNTQSLNIHQWKLIISAFQEYGFSTMIPNDSSAVIDGTFTQLKFETFKNKQTVSRKWLEKDAFYQLCKRIDSLSINPLENL